MTIRNVTKKDVLDCAEKYGNKPATDLLMLAGPDGFDGTVNEYNELLNALTEVKYE